MTHATLKGLQIGDLVSISAVGPRCPHDLDITQPATFDYDDGSQSPQFRQGSHTQYVYLGYVTKLAEQGPKAGVKWTDAPAGSTHYAMNTAYFSKWHKVQDGIVSFWHVERQEWVQYTVQGNQQRFELVEIPGVVKKPAPVETVAPAVETLKADLARVEKRLTRTGAKLGRAKARTATLEQVYGELKAEQAKIKAAIDAAPVVPKITSAKELVELMHDASKWKKGMRVVCREDHVSGITVGKKYVLTDDAQMGHHVSIYFIGDNGSKRTRPAKYYQLVTTDLV